MGLTQITAVESFESAMLTDADAIPDGFPSMAALQSESQTTHGIPRRLSMPGSMTNGVAVRETE